MVDLLKNGDSYFVSAPAPGFACEETPELPHAPISDPAQQRIVQLADPAQVPSYGQNVAGSFLAGRLISAQPAHDVRCAAQLFRESDRILDRLTGALAKIQ